MQIRWSQVRDRKEGLYLQDTLDMSQIQRENRAVIRISPASVQLHAVEDSGVLHADGRVAVRITYRCSRCLTDFEVNHEEEIHENFVQRVVTSEEEEEDFRSVQGDVIEVDPFIYETLVLSLPYRPLCNEDCAGLCPACGTNRNLSPCTCDITPVDPRLAGLASFLSDDEE